MTKKQIVCSMGFILSACAVLYLLCDLFEVKNIYNSDKRFNTYRSLAPNTVDAVMVGTSGMDRYWIPSQAYEEYGMTVYTLSTGGQPAWLFEYVIEEAFTYQNPELIVIDMRSLGQGDVEESKMDARARSVLDSLEPISVNRVRAGLKTMEVFHENYEDKPRFDISYLLSVAKYHEMWLDEEYLTKQHLSDRQHKFLGFYINKRHSIEVTPQEKVIWDSEYYEQLDPLAEEALYDLLEYLKDKDVNVLFALTPKFSTVQEVGRMNTVMDILEKEGVGYINFCETDEEGNFLYVPDLNSQTDFYNKDHTNYYGAEKFTRVFSAYLDEQYDLPDHRGEEAVKEQWDSINAAVKKRIKKYEKKAKQKENAEK